MDAEGLRLLEACLDESERLIDQYHQTTEDPESQKEIAKAVEAVRSYLTQPGGQNRETLLARQTAVWEVHQKAGGLNHQTSAVNKFTRAVWYMVEAAICLSSKKNRNGAYMAERSRNEFQDADRIIRAKGWAAA